MKNNNSIIRWRMWVLLLSGLLMTGCKQTADPFELSNYRPVDDFVPAYEALTSQQLAQGDYDLEKTVRVMNALELAQANSEISTSSSR